MNIAYTNSGTAQVVFPQEYYEKCLTENGCESEINIDNTILEKTIRSVYSDYKSNKIDIDTFCEIGEYLFYKLKNGDGKTKKLVSVLLDCSELKYYIQIKENDSNEYNEILERIDNYFITQ